eukprot:CAMPEP_0205827966 /NCGR_PEP_ID=MMETSP0206-20130828/33679_1 /ASSEMBLY_ACC=CAM_ASM_000279 /TAXON_ID=36767 /ORGANISM="Euplotes focardii, Strain TN1" /LENGTH=359 /DNA_ID=CAMNT_0053129349 /DNA_START=189 /DNA_END=1265 /DNA_ORIENTATION=+
MIAGGVLGNNEATTKKKERSHIKRPMKSLFTNGVHLKKEKVVSFDPENNTLTTNKGTVTYDYLIVTPGTKLRYDQVEGATEALDDPDHPVVSIYREDYAYKTLRHREKFMGGTAIFNQPKMPIKCGGAPQKILYLSDSRWKELGRGQNINTHFYTAAPVMFPPCSKYSDSLEKHRESLGIPVHYKQNLLAIDKNNKQAIFKNLDTGVEEGVNYDFFHIVPPQTAMKFVADSVLADPYGYVETDKDTMQHPRFPNVFSCGDSAGTPASKTAASAFSQIPVLVHNLVEASKGKTGSAKYNGYGSCPLFTGNKKLMLAEFSYGGKPHETFYKGQDKPSKFFYHMKKDVFPWVYFNLVARGKW